MRRQQVERYSGKFADFPVSEKIPAPPEGFGKRTYEKGIDEDPPDDTQADRDSISQVEGSAPSEQLEIDPVEQRFGETEHDAAIYCKFCQMWLSGSTQWAEPREQARQSPWTSTNRKTPIPGRSGMTMVRVETAAPAAADAGELLWRIRSTRPTATAVRLGKRFQDGPPVAVTLSFSLRRSRSTGTVAGNDSRINCLKRRGAERVRICRDQPFRASRCSLHECITSCQHPV